MKYIFNFIQPFIEQTSLQLFTEVSLFWSHV